MSVEAPLSPDLLDEPRFMIETGVAARVATLITPVLRDLELRLVRVKLLSQNGTLVQIMIERPDGRVTIDECEQASVAISPLLDVEEVISGIWTLEVSSPGIDRPLVRLSDLRRALEHEAKFETKMLVAGRKRFKGWIKGVEGEGSEAKVQLRLTEAHPDEPSDLSLEIADIAEGHLVLTHALIQETLRAHKLEHEAQEGTDSQEPEGSQEEAEAPSAPVRRGPGRFAKAKTPLQRKGMGKRSTK